MPFNRAEIGEIVGIHTDTIGRWLKLDKNDSGINRGGRRVGDVRLLSAASSSGRSCRGSRPGKFSNDLSAMHSRLSNGKGITDFKISQRAFILQCGRTTGLLRALKTIHPHLHIGYRQRATDEIALRDIAFLLLQ